MPDSITPVGAMVQPPDPMRGLNTLSSILGVQQQQQNLQTGAYRQQAIQADSQQAQQRNSELQALGTYTRNASKDPSYLNADGTPNVQKYQQGANQVAPVYGQEYIGQMTSNFNSAVQNRKALLDLSNEQRATIGNYFGAVAAKPGATKEDMLDAAEQARAVSPDRNYQRAIDGMLMHIPQTEGMTSDQASMAIRQAARQAAVGTNALSASQSAPAITGVNTLGGVQQVQTNPQSPLGVGKVGQPVAGSSLPAIAGASAAATTQAGGGAGRDVDRANAVSTGQRDAAAALPLTIEVDRLSHEISASSIAGAVTQGLKNLGFTDVANARTQLNKDLGLLTGPLAQRAGSDTRAADILKGYPTDQTPESTTHAAMDYIRGTLRQTMARGQLLKRHGQDGFAAADDELTRSTDPLVYEAASLKPGQSNGFYKRNFGSPQEAQAFKNRVDALKQHTSFIGTSDGQ